MKFQVSYINGKGKEIVKYYASYRTATSAVAKLQIIGIKAGCSPIM